VQSIPYGGRHATSDSRRLSKAERQTAIREYMAAKSTFGDHRFFGAQGRIADALGFSRMTIHRDMKEMEARGEIERTGEMWAWQGWKRTVVYRVAGRRLRHRVTRCSSSRSTRTFKTTTPFGCGARARPRRGRRRRLMESNPAPMGQLRLVRASGEETAFNAGDAIAATVDVVGVVAPQFKARIGKDAKLLLDAGWQPDTVVAACVMAVRMGRPHLVQTFAQEIQNAKSGLVVDWPEYRRAIEKLNHESRPPNAVDDAFRKMREGKIR
jgi:DNA-binding Lrp family transcriptional regulator